MQSHYEINVSRNGRHFFATAPRSCVSREDVKAVYAEIKARFPEADGFTVTVSYQECIGYGVDPTGDFDCLPEEDND